MGTTPTATRTAATATRTEVSCLPPGVDHRLRVGDTARQAVGANATTMIKSGWERLDVGAVADAAERAAASAECTVATRTNPHEPAGCLPSMGSMGVCLLGMYGVASLVLKRCCRDAWLLGTGARRQPRRITEGIPVLVASRSESLKAFRCSSPVSQNY